MNAQSKNATPIRLIRKKPSTVGLKIYGLKGKPRLVVGSLGRIVNASGRLRWTTPTAERGRHWSMGDLMREEEFHYLGHVPKGVRCRSYSDLLRRCIKAEGL